MERTSKFGYVFLGLFALPFAAFGLFALFTGIHQLLEGAWQPQSWFLLPFGLIFCGIGFGLIYAAIAGNRMLAKQQRVQAEHPAEPWLWRDDWAQGRISGSLRPRMIGAWVIAALSMTVSVPILFHVPRQAAETPIAYLGLIFPLASAYLVVRATRLTLAFRAFWKTYFEITPVPGVVGGELKGIIQTQAPRAPDNAVQLRLSCINRITSASDDSQTNSEHVLWHGGINISPAQMYPGPAGLSIPVSFRIPWHAQPTATRTPNDVILWQLEFLADIPGLNHRDVFEVPVFRTAQTPAHPEPGAAADAAPASPPKKPTVVVTECASGVEFYFPPARNMGFAIGATLSCLLLGMITYLIAGSRAPAIFAIASGLFTLLLLYAAAQMWIGTTRVGIGSSGLILEDGFLGNGKRRRFAFAEIASIGNTIKGQQGSAAENAYYDIELNLRSGKKVTLGRTIRNRQEADWLVEEMGRLAGLPPKAMSAGGAR